MTFIAEIQHTDEEKEATDAAKEACLEAQKDRGAVAVKEKQYKDARATAWQAAKDTHLHEVVRWEEVG